MNSPAQRHLERTSAAQTAASHVRSATLICERMRLKLASDYQRLKSIQSIERKVAVKRALLPDYADYVAGVLEGGPGAQDDVLMTVMVWRIDTGDYPGALALAAYALRYGLTLPDPYQRTTATLITEDIAEAALAAVGTVPLDVLRRLAELTEAHDMPDPVRAKLHKALGWALQADDPATALIHWRRALELHERCGVKKDIERLERVLTETMTNRQDECVPPPRGAGE